MYTLPLVLFLKNLCTLHRTMSVTSAALWIYINCGYFIETTAEALEEEMSCGSAL